MYVGHDTSSTLKYNTNTSLIQDTGNQHLHILSFNADFVSNIYIKH